MRRKMGIVMLVVVTASLCLVDGFSVSPGLAKAPAVPARRGGACSHASLGLVVEGGRRNRAASSRLGALDLKAQDCPGSATWREEGSPKAGTVLVAHDLEADHFFRQAAVRDRGAAHTTCVMTCQVWAMLFARALTAQGAMQVLVLELGPQGGKGLILEMATAFGTGEMSKQVMVPAPWLSRATAGRQKIRVSCTAVIPRGAKSYLGVTISFHWRPLHAL